MKTPATSLNILAFRAKKKPAGPAPTAGLPELGAEKGDYDMGAESAAQALIHALETKDPKAVVEAFKNLDEMCGAEGAGEEGHEGGGAEEEG